MSEPLAYPSRRQARATAARHARHSGLTERAAPTARARHASARGEGFGRLVGLTTLGTVLPGSSLVAGGRRRLGGALLLLFLLALLTLGVLALSGEVVSVGLRLATRPGALLAIAVTIGVVGAVWCAAVVGGHVLLRPGRLTAVQRVLSAALVVSLVGLVALPSATGVRYALAQRSLILTVFDDDGRDADLASPDVNAEDPWAGTRRVNVLLLGSDAGAGRTGTRTDTMVVASINTRTGDTVLFSIPRNLEGPIFAEGTVGAEQFPDGFYPSGWGACVENDCHMNAVWSWAEANSHLFERSRQAGLTATRDAISGVLDLPIDYYAIVNLDGFKDVVNAIGGLEMNVQRRIPIGGGVNQLTGGRHPITGYIEPGQQVLNGYEALWYARSREGSDDYDRMARQQCVIAAFAEQANPVRLARAFPTLAASAERNVFTDVRSSELEAFVELALRVQEGSIESMSFDRAVIRPENPDFDEIHRIVEEAISPSRPTPSSAPSGGATSTEPPTTPSSPDEPTQGTSGPTQGTSQDGGPEDGGPEDGDSQEPAPDPDTPVGIDQACG